MNAKQQAALKAVEYIKTGMTIGLGTGSTAYWAIEAIGERVTQGLEVKAIATSVRTEELAKQFNIPLTGFAGLSKLDISIDGADEVDENLQLIKGGGGALLREKIVSAATEFYIVIVDESKLVSTLGKFKVPVEVVKFGYEMTIQKLQSLGAQTFLRMNEENIFVTDNGNYIIDCAFPPINDPASLHNSINNIAGVVENGLFIDLVDLVISGSGSGVREIRSKV